MWSHRHASISVCAVCRPSPWRVQGICCPHGSAGTAIHVCAGFAMQAFSSLALLMYFKRQLRVALDFSTLFLFLILCIYVLIFIFFSFCLVWVCFSVFFSISLNKNLTLKICDFWNMNVQFYKRPLNLWYVVFSFSLSSAYLKFFSVKCRIHRGHFEACFWCQATWAF